MSIENNREVSMKGENTKKMYSPEDWEMEK